MPPPPKLSPDSTYVTLHLVPPAVIHPSINPEAPAKFPLPSPLPDLHLVGPVGELQDEFIYEVGSSLSAEQWKEQRSNVLLALKGADGVKAVREMQNTQRSKRGGEF